MSARVTLAIRNPTWPKVVVVATAVGVIGVGTYEWVLVAQADLGSARRLLYLGIGLFATAYSLWFLWLWLWPELRPAWQFRLGDEGLVLEAPHLSHKPVLISYEEMAGFAVGDAVRSLLARSILGVKLPLIYVGSSFALLSMKKGRPNFILVLKSPTQLASARLRSRLNFGRYVHGLLAVVEDPELAQAELLSRGIGRAEPGHLEDLLKIRPDWLAGFKAGLLLLVWILVLFWEVTILVQQLKINALAN